MALVERLLAAPDTSTPLGLRDRGERLVPIGRATLDAVARWVESARPRLAKDETPLLFLNFRDKGRLAPEGLAYLARWVTADLQHCYQVMECTDGALLDAWIARRSDLVEFEVIPVP